MNTKRYLFGHVDNTLAAVLNPANYIPRTVNIVREVRLLHV